MTVVDTSVFIDELFNFDQNRHEKARQFFRLLQDKSITIAEPEMFKIELIGQLVRRMKRDEAALLYELIIERVELVRTEDLKEIAFSIAFETGCRAIDSFYIATAKVRDAILVSNDKIQVESAKKFGVNAFYLIEELEEIKKKLGE